MSSSVTLEKKLIASKLFSCSSCFTSAVLKERELHNLHRAPLLAVINLLSANIYFGSVNHILQGELVATHQTSL